MNPVNDVKSLSPIYKQKYLDSKKGQKRARFRKLREKLLKQRK